MPKTDSRGIPRSGMIDQNLNWDDLTWLRSLTRLPIVVKGVLSPEDAELAVKYGASGVWVSNHGGRQVDGAVTAVCIR